MARKKKTSKVLEKAEMRLSGMKSIDPNMDFGQGISVTAMEKATSGLQKALDGYNTLLSKLDGKLNQIKEKEKKLRDVSERMLLGVGTKYGKDSDEYEQAGGVKKSERKRKKKKKE